jgi:hypothetical protein
MARIQPVYGVDYSKLLQQGLQAYSQVKGMQRQSEQYEQRNENRERQISNEQKQREYDEKLADLKRRAVSDPVAFQELSGIDPKAALAIQNLGRGANEIKNIEAGEKRKVSEEARKVTAEKQKTDARFLKESVFLAKKIKGKPINEQISIVNRQIELVESRGGDASNTRGLRDKLEGDENLQNEAQEIINDRVETGYLNKIITRPIEDTKLQKLELEMKRLNKIKALKDLDLSNKQISIVMKADKDFGEEYGVLIAQIEAIPPENTEMIASKKFELEQSLRKEYSRETEDFQKVQESYRKIKSIDPTAAGDIALVFNYMKMLDPGSVVREGEYATAKNAAGVPDIIMNQYNKLRSGKFLNPVQRADFRKQSKNLFGAVKIKEKAVREKLMKEAKRYKLNPDSVFYSVPEEEDYHEVPKDAETQVEPVAEAPTQPNTQPLSQDEMNLLGL